MKENKKRIYISKSREDQALQTRHHILQAAKTLFQEEGFDRVTINKLASEASVSMPTIYAIFKSKRGVLQALIDEAFPPQQHAALVEVVMKANSPKKMLDTTAKLTCRIYDAEKELMDILRGATVVAPEFKELEQEREIRRYERQGDCIRKMHDQKALAKGLTMEKARDILWVLTGRDMYRLFVVERGWKSSQYEKWLAELLIKSLLDSEY